MTDYEKLKAVIHAANPEMEIWCKECSRYVKENVAGQCWECNHFTLHRDLPRPIRLADVLLTLKKSLKTMDEWHEITSKLILPFWKLEDDNLDNQSNECKQFLIDLLIKK